MWRHLETKTMEIKIDKKVRGTRIISGGQARNRRKLLNKMIDLSEKFGFEEIILPSLEFAEIYTDKAGPEILGQMYVFDDKKQRKLCLRPEGTATIQLIAEEHWQDGKERKVWYFEKCWRYERPQAGRYREFYQFGLEIINPKSNCKDYLIRIAKAMVELVTTDYVVTESVKRGLSYYIEDGFEISCPELGAQKQVCGGGAYKQGIGFAIGFDRLELCIGKKC